jgi:hypothetical protein
MTTRFYNGLTDHSVTLPTRVFPSPSADGRLQAKGRVLQGVAITLNHAALAYLGWSAETGAVTASRTIPGAAPSVVRLDVVALRARRVVVVNRAVTRSNRMPW